MKAILIGFLLTLSAPSFAAFPSSLKWRTLKSAHFNFIYAEPNKALAEIYAAASERAFAELTPLFIEVPSTPIPVLISDNTDLANGSATFLPYPLIIAYPVLPNALDSITHYENWVYELMIHELTHLFNMEPAHSFYKPFTYIFGTIVRPNAVLPRWYLEGLAVEVESRYTSHGRIRSPSTAAAMRAITLMDRWNKENLENVNESSIPTWPYGQRPYMFGSLFWHSFVEQHGLQIIPELNQRFSRRVPFFLNSPFEDYGGQDLKTRWNLLREDLSKQSQTQIDLIKQSGAMPETPFKNTGDQQVAAAISPNGAHLIYLSSPKFESSVLQLITRPLPVVNSFTAESNHRLIEVAGATRVAWLPDSSGVVFDQLSIYNRYYRYRDLYLLRLDDPQNPKRLTFGVRGSEPTVSPNGHDVVFVRTRAGSTELALFNMNTRKFRALLKPRHGLRLSQPTFQNERTIVFIGRDSKAKDRLYSLDIKTLKRTALPDIAPILTSVRQTADGLVVAANRTGVSNLYLVKNGSAPQALTNSLTEVVQGDYDSMQKEVVFTQLSGEGLKLTATPLATYNPPQVDRLAAQTFKNETTPRAALNISKVETKDENYWPIRYLVPRYWIPFVYPVEGGMIFQGSNQTSDPTERHNYSLSGSYDSVTKQTSYGFRYVNASTPINLGLTVAETNELLAAQSQRVSNQFYGIDGDFFFAGLSNSWRGSVELMQIDSAVPTTSGTRSVDRLGASGGLSYNSGAGQLVAKEWGESFFAVKHTSFISGEDRIVYEKTAGNLGVRWRGPFPARQSLVAQIKGSSAPNLGLNNLVALGDRTIGGNYLVSLINSNYLLRGYPSGALVGRTLINANLEYRFPAGDIYKGSGTFPLFFRSLEMAAFVDSALVDGAYFNPTDLRFYRSRTDDIFTGTGLEFTLVGTAAYHLPVTFTLGLYYGLNDKAGGGFIPFISLGYVGHGGVDKSSDTSTRFRPASLAR